MYQDNLRNQSEKEIYQPGALRIVSHTLFQSLGIIHDCHHDIVSEIISMMNIQYFCAPLISYLFTTRDNT